VDFEESAKVKELKKRVQAFMDEHIFPNEALYYEQLDKLGRWKVPPILEELKTKARKADLWNLFLPDSKHGHGLSNLEYAPLSEIMGWVHFASEVFNCSAPDTGNMETLERYASKAQQDKWLTPLLEGKIRSAFVMTEPDVASSDATNISLSIKPDGDHYVLNGRKWFSSGLGDPHCKIMIVMGKSFDEGPKYGRHSMILVEPDVPGFKVKRMLSVLGYDDAPHGHAEVEFNNVRVPKENMLLGEGRGFEIAQGRLGPGRIHHCMRMIGMAERALQLMSRRAANRVAFGRKLAEQGVIIERVAQSRIDIEQARLLTLRAAWAMDKFGNKEARSEIAMIKVVAPQMAFTVIDRAMQVHGAMGVTQDTPLAYFMSRARAIRFADGPDEVHRHQLGRTEIKRQTNIDPDRH